MVSPLHRGANPNSFVADLQYLATFRLNSQSQPHYDMMKLILLPFAALLALNAQAQLDALPPCAVSPTYTLSTL